MKSKSSKKKKNERTGFLRVHFPFLAVDVGFTDSLSTVSRLDSQSDAGTITLFTIKACLVFYNKKISCIHYSNKRLAPHLAKQKMKEENKTAHKQKRIHHQQLSTKPYFIYSSHSWFLFLKQSEKEEKDIQRKLEITEITA